jgi:hypothetical protein
MPGIVVSLRQPRKNHATSETNVLWHSKEKTSPTQDIWKLVKIVLTNIHGWEIPRALALLVATVTTIKATSRRQLRKLKVKAQNKP